MAITYTPTTNFGAKDSLPTNDPDKVIKGSEFTTEFSAIQTSFNLAAPAASPTFTGDVTLSNGDVLLGDDNKAIFGDGSDLQIYHDGSNSYIQDAGTGNLILKGANIEITTGAGNKYFQGAANIARLYHTNNEKLATTSTGIDVTGTAAADAVTISPSSGDATLTLSSNASQPWEVYSPDSSNDLRFKSDSTDYVTIDTSGNLGIGTTSPSSVLHLSTSNDPQITLTDTGFGASADITGSNGNLRLNSQTATIFDMADSEVARIDSSGRVGIGTTSPANQLHIASGAASIRLEDTDNNTYGQITYNTASGGLLIRSDEGSGVGASGSNIIFETDGAEAARVDASGNLLVGTTAVGYSSEGVVLRERGESYITSDGRAPLLINRLTDDGDLVSFRKDGTEAGVIGSKNSDLVLGTGACGIRFIDGDPSVSPVTTNGGTLNDNAIDLGRSTSRFKDIYRAGSTISTSDRNMKQDERPLTQAEANVAQACKGLLKAFRFIDAVETDGDGARIHFGIIAQDLQAAFEAEGLDANRYQMFRPSTFTNDEGNEETRLGVCYENLLAFIVAAL